VSRAPFIAARCRLKGERHARDGVDHKTTGRSTIERRPHWQAELAGAPSARVRQLDAVKIETRASPLHAGDPRDRDKGQPERPRRLCEQQRGGAGYVVRGRFFRGEIEVRGIEASAGAM